MDAAVILICALLLNAAFAGPRRWYAGLGITRYARIPAGIVRKAERKLNRRHRSNGALELRGVILAVMAVALSLTAGSLLAWLFDHNLHFIEIVLLACLLPVRQSWDCASQIVRSLKSGNLPEARRVLEHTAWRHHALMDDYGVARAGIEILAVHFGEKILAPILFYLLFGLPGFFVSKILYLLQETLVTSATGAQGFGKAAQWLHMALHYIPSRLAALLWLAAGIALPSAKPAEAARAIAAGIALSPQAFALLVAASVLRLSLGGPTSVYASEWLGAGTARPGHMDIRKAMLLFALLHLLLFILLGGGFFL